MPVRALSDTAMQQPATSNHRPSPMIEAIETSRMFRESIDAIRLLAGLDVHLLDGGQIDSDLRRAAETTGLCGDLCANCDRCRQCRDGFAQRMRSHGNRHAGPYAMRCFAGLTVSALPLTLGDNSVAFLYAAPVFVWIRRRGRATGVLVKRVSRTRVGIPLRRLRETASRVPVLERQHYHAAISLLRIIAAQVSHLSRQMLAPADTSHHEKVLVQRCRDLLDRCFTEDVHVDQVSKELKVSRSYLSRLLANHLGMSFTDCLHDLRLAEFKRLLAASELTITEALFAAGFQSVSQANRVFRVATGISPRDFRNSRKR
jgi:AraC-like DNA-binding protein